ncbi:37S ribosomal protein S23, mitochondrial [Neolecta irregularis DAH-3]|uniref:Small ribosomal subunit protein mS29 n=1 Tax=Neolecta irregularis (strain DAH-3) TaxID=1198029 RepID=A0A1U7LW32_NEOID|nr:37S ribosomal protein S23, mitochondrial [Neolecta irregularis DAH-3]|eukprot:OLL26844.1 37S ribosomal protein S23, mitochondrial [Neolecta irregularis DAH-3]
MKLRRISLQASKSLKLYTRALSASRVCAKGPAVASKKKKASKPGYGPSKKKDKGSGGNKVKTTVDMAFQTTSLLKATLGCDPISSSFSARPKNLDIEELLKDSLTNSSLCGSCLASSAAITAKLSTLQVFHPCQGFQYFYQFSPVIRNETIDLCQRLDGKASSEMRRCLLTGPAGSGKSVLLLQAQVHALMNDWIVIAVPRGLELVDNTTSYSLDKNSGLYHQHQFTAALLERTKDANLDALGGIKCTRSYSFGQNKTIQLGDDLTRLIGCGIRDPLCSYEVLQALMEQLNQENRPSVLLTLDNFSALSVPSKYFTADLKSIHPHDFALASWFISYLNGSKKLVSAFLLDLSDI